MNSTGLLSAIVPLVFSLAIAAGYTAVAWLIHRRWRLLGLALLWAFSSAAYGYVSFAVICRNPLTCDVASSDFLFYLTHVGPSYALVGASGFAAASAVILARSRSASDRLRVAGLVYGTLAAMGGWMFGILMMPRLLAW